jgi:CubicO group peptidase (beta-lactamase class C family)
LDSELVTDLYCEASLLDTIDSLLVIKNGQLVAEEYYHDGSVGALALNQSVGKSYASALVGLAFDQGCLTDLDQQMMDFFPELDDQIDDPRKREITIRQLLQMRSGYPWEEEGDPAIWERFAEGEYYDLIADHALVNDPGDEFHYSNLTPYILQIIVTRQCGVDLTAFAEEHLFVPIGAGTGEWYQDSEDYYYPFASFTARDMARFGQLYLDDGVSGGTQVLSAGWVRESLDIYTEDAWHIKVGPNVQEMGYGYQWWSVKAGDHRYNMAWGHGGQQIVVLDELEMVIVATSDPFIGAHNDKAWKQEKKMLNLIGDFVATLLAE